MISIGNLAVGGRGKTPLVARVAARLREAGERPSVLSRGYGREDTADALVVVRDPGGIRADLGRAGDEPLMLARQLDGVTVIACADRYAAGQLAESEFGATVHVLDDGFQHLQLYRDLDLVLLARDDVERPVTLPAGRLREPIESRRLADAILALDDEVLAKADGRPAWRARRTLDTPRLVEPYGEPAHLSQGSVVAVAGIASPGRFFEGLRAAGWPLSRTMAFRDHHRYTRRDIDRILHMAHVEGAAMIVTTEKDLVRLLPFRPFPVQVAFVPMTLTIDGSPPFDDWILAAVRRAREAA